MSNNDPQHHQQSGKIESVRFTLDGRTLETGDKSPTAAAVLSLAGLDPAGYDLAEVRPGHADLKRFVDDELVHVQEGDAFVSIRQSAQVA